MMPDKNA